jgi:hypothetical protein
MERTGSAIRNKIKRGMKSTIERVKNGSQCVQRQETVQDNGAAEVYLHHVRSLPSLLLAAELADHFVIAHISSDQFELCMFQVTTSLESSTRARLDGNRRCAVCEYIGVRSTVLRPRFARI